MRLNIFNYYCAIAHDAIVGNWNVLSPRVTLTGGAEIGDGNFLGTSAGVAPYKKIGNNRKIQAGVITQRDVGNGCFIYSSAAVKKSVLFLEED